MYNALLILGGYALIIWLLTIIFTKVSKKKEAYLAANRKVGVIPGALSIAGGYS
jgi:Na+/proline symporter